MKQDSHTIRNTLFPRRIIINFIASAILILVLFFLATAVINNRAKVRNENIYKNQQILQVRMVAQAIEDNLNSIFYNIDIIQLYCRDLFTGEREMSNSFFQLVQTSKQEVTAFIVVDDSGNVRYRSFSIGGEGKAAQELILSYIDKYQSKIAGGLNYVPPLYITKDMQLAIKLVPIWRNGRKSGVIGVALNFLTAKIARRRATSTPHRILEREGFRMAPCRGASYVAPCVAERSERRNVG